MAKTATTQVPVHPLIAQRWSPRGFDRTHDLDPRQLAALLEAARWSASANNTQPWRFLVTRRGDAPFDRLLTTLAAGNAVWARHADALVLVAAETVDDAGEPRHYALYDTGQAVANLVMQAQAEGLAAHQMGGFDAAAAGEEFALPASLSPVVVVAVGRHDPGAELPEALAEREQARRTRRPLEDLLLSGHETELARSA